MHMVRILEQMVTCTTSLNLSAVVVAVALISGPVDLPRMGGPTASDGLRVWSYRTVQDLRFYYHHLNLVTLQPAHLSDHQASLSEHQSYSTVQLDHLGCLLLHLLLLLNNLD